MKQYKLVIAGTFYGTKTFPSFNDYRQRQTTSPLIGAKLLKDCETVVIHNIRKQMKGVKFVGKITPHFYFYEPDKKRDLDNILGFAEKAVFDALQYSGILENDNQKFITSLTAEVITDKANPRIEVVFDEEE